MLQGLGLYLEPVAGWLAQVISWGDGLRSLVMASSPKQQIYLLGAFSFILDGTTHNWM